MTNGIGSAGLGDGLLPLKWQDGETGQLTQGLVHAKVSPAPAKARDLTIQEICGPTFSESSSGADLSARLASKLAQRLSSDGSIEYSLKWVQKATPAGRRYCQLAASVRRISETEYSGWPTCSAHKNTKNSKDPKCLKENGVQSSLADAAHLCLSALSPRPKTPSASDGEGGVMEVREDTTGKFKLRDYAVLTAWGTPNTFASGGTPEGELERKRKAIEAGSSMGMVVSNLDHQVKLIVLGPAKATDESKGGPQQTANTDLPSYAVLTAWASCRTTDSHGSKEHGQGGQGLHTQANPCAPGPATPSSCVQTAKRDGLRLNPRFSLWLMGFPNAWSDAAQRILAKTRSRSRKDAPTE